MSEPSLLRTVAEMRAWSRAAARAGKSLGCVPTMGALHAGHRSLIERARRENDLVVVTIFVNPAQFGPGEDYGRYPRTFEADRRLCGEAGADAIFAPEARELYHPDARTRVEVCDLQDRLCGLSRPGHFRGVCLVVAKLLSLIRPDRAYFGRKDAQQLRILEILARDLDLGCEIIPCETVREADGLAMSSRNQYLAPEERRKALCLYRALEFARQRVAEGERDALRIAGGMSELIEKTPDAEIDYVALVDPETLEDVERISGEVLAALAVKIGVTRLIDNMRLRPPD
jgi:pantoate--beta-alanine ligase